MTPRALYDRFRSDVVDVAQTYLWSDAEVLGYEDDAQRMFCRLTGGLRDATSAVTQIPIVSTQAFVDIDPSVLRIRAATKTSNHCRLRIISYEEAVACYAPGDWALTGNVGTLIIGMEDEKLRLMRVPSANDTLALVVERLPLVSLAVAKPTALPDTFEIREEHHLALLLWMKHLAYMKQDAETFNKEKSDVMGAAFKMYCARAFDEKQARVHKPRLIAYGGL